MHRWRAGHVRPCFVVFRLDLFSPLYLADPLGLPEGQACKEWRGIPYAGRKAEYRNVQSRVASCRACLGSAYLMMTIQQSGSHHYRINHSTDVPRDLFTGGSVVHLNFALPGTLQPFPGPRITGSPSASSIAASSPNTIPMGGTPTHHLGDDRNFLNRRPKSPMIVASTHLFLIPERCALGSIACMP